MTRPSMPAGSMALLHSHWRAVAEDGHALVTVREACRPTAGHPLDSPRYAGYSEGMNTHESHYPRARTRDAPRPQIRLRRSVDERPGRPENPKRNRHPGGGPRGRPARGSGVSKPCVDCGGASDEMLSELNGEDVCRDCVAAGNESMDIYGGASTE